ncbi:MAG: penicillin acylase family protein [Gammaproteobacteria bacterium]
MKRWLVVLTLLLAAPAGIGLLLTEPLPPSDGEIKLTGLKHEVKVTFDPWGVPTLHAATREEAFFALGFLTAGDRLFQLDLSRRKAAGRLAEVFGAGALESDRHQRTLGTERAAATIVATLPLKQRRLLEAYAGGINAFINQNTILPFEFWITGHRPAPWAPADSILVAINMFQLLTDTERDERMLSVMSETLPNEVTAFLTPDTDAFSAPLLGGEGSYRPIQPIPFEALAELRDKHRLTVHRRTVTGEAPVLGSNSWAVAASKTRTGRALVANDMHLPLSIPNTWYRAALRYGKRFLAGLTIPGIPLLVAGSNGDVAWGFTNVNSDVLDLVRIEIDPTDPNRYRTPAGWRAFEIRTEQIAVKGAANMALDVKHTIWGPVSQTLLLGQLVAVKWTALEPDAVNLDLMDIEKARSVADALRIMNRAGGPPQNVTVADRDGRIGWTIMGRIPLRAGFDGSTARSWARGKIGWVGYIPQAAIPRLVDPRNGFIATANNRTLGKGYPYSLGHNYAHDYRAFRINEQLGASRSITEPDMLNLQLDTKSRVYNFYRALALEVLDTATPWEAEVRRALLRWDGRARTDSIGFAFLADLRRRLIETTLSPFLQPCLDRDPEFSYRWFKVDSPLRQLLLAKRPETLPASHRYPDWNAFLIDVIEDTYIHYKRHFGYKPLHHLTWGEVNRTRIGHPFSARLPWLRRFLDMPADPLAGCAHCVRVVFDNHGASERFVVSPGHEEQGILHIPGGQSGHPLSIHYRDQHAHWVSGRPLPFLSREVSHTLILTPPASHAR